MGNRFRTQWMARSVFSAAMATVAVTATVTVIAGATVEAHAGARVVNGVTTSQFPSTGMLVYSGNAGLPLTADNGLSWCTGILIGCSTFLTAAHCVEGDALSAHYGVYLQNGDVHALSSVKYHPQYTTDLWSRDVAVLKLTVPVVGIQPTAVNSTHNLAVLGTGRSGTIVGFGRTGGGNDYGVKRRGQIVTANCDTVATGGAGNDVLVCWNYDSNVGPPGTDSNSCNGDSGGPLLMTFSGRTEVVGTTSAGVETNCGVGDHSWDASVYYHSAWILGELGADSTDACGGIAPVGDPATHVQQTQGALDAVTTQSAFNVEVAGSPARLVFALNGLNNGFNPNFYVKKGTGAGPGSYDCKSDGLSMFGACSFTNPAPGTWSVLVTRVAGAGDFQLTTTQFAATPTVCGDASLNGSISASDAQTTLRAGVGSVHCELCVCDVNDSGSVSAADALLLLKAGVGQSVALSCAKCG